MARSRRRPMALRLLMDLIVIYGAVVLLAFLFQRKLMYFPGSSPVETPSGDPYSSLEDVTLSTQDGLRIRGWYWPGTRPVTLLIFHGNGGHRGHRLEWLEDLHSLGMGVFLLDYRGYGGSEGSPTEAGLYLDAEAARSWVEKRTGSAIVYFGESLGTSVAVELARRHPPSALILQSGFSSAVDVARRAYPFLPVRLLLKDRFETRAKLPEAAAPVLVIHGDKDSIVPASMGRSLYEAAREPREWYLVPGADHNDLPWVGGRAYLERIDEFVRRHAEGTVGGPK